MVIPENNVISSTVRLRGAALIKLALSPKKTEDKKKKAEPGRSIYE